MPNEGNACPTMLPQCVERLGNIEEDVREIRKDVGVMRTVIIGNGNPQESITSRLTKAETDARHMKWLVHLLVAGLLVMLLKTIFAP